MNQVTLTQRVHPILLQMAQDQPLPSGFETRADLVKWLGEQTKIARTIAIRYAVAADQPDFTDQARQMMESARGNLRYFEGELIAHRVILETECLTDSQVSWR